MVKGDHNHGTGARAKSHITSHGLEGVVVADSQLCYIDGLAGTLSYRGYDIADLAERCSYEETVHLLWFGELPNSAQLQDFKHLLIRERDLNPGIIGLMSSFPTRPEPIEMLRTVVSALSAYDSESDVRTTEADLGKSIRLVAKLPTAVASYCRILDDEEPIPPDPSLDHASNFLYMLAGRKPSALKARAMDMALIAMADHGLNASTFAARVTAATLSDMYSAVTSAIGALKGPLHGAANRGAMEMMLEIGEPDRVEEFIDRALADGKRIMGFGHRVYKTMDPRAKMLRSMLGELSHNGSDPRWAHVAMRIQEVVAERKQLSPNVDFYAGAMMYMLGVPLNVFTPVFACSRVAGWTAQVMEQYANNRLIRPLASYVGPRNREFVPLADR